MGVEPELVPAAQGPARGGLVRRGSCPAALRGVSVDWAALFAGWAPTGSTCPLMPSSAGHYWLRSPGASPGRPPALGPEAAGHPLLGAAVRPADAEALLFTGVLSLRTHPWLRDHVVAGSVLFPGAAFVELARTRATRWAAGWSRS